MAECGCRNAEGAEVTQRTQKKYQKWVWVWVWVCGEALRLVAALPRRACQLKAPRSNYPPVEGYAVGGGGGGGGGGEQGL